MILYGQLAVWAGPLPPAARVVIPGSGDNARCLSAYPYRCLRRKTAPPDTEELVAVAHTHVPEPDRDLPAVVDAFVARNDSSSLAREQLLGAVAPHACTQTELAWAAMLRAIGHCAPAQP